ncbi:ornithine carbamoyltransferase [Oxalicibacterium flavum]|uniref:Ornithine carbamoyltransferase n=1 Tax=Oxalicibacterium flavum TaxID=179467 RepID=A0A8J2XXX5_9BURK|nr:ornithine carbamoyltransferase [Oxalicibacterium flavum]GGC17117.1 ornithine carbamoyltransferase [Oxalicibacterium flavum]
MNLLRISDLDSEDVYKVFNLVDAPPPHLTGTVGWSFEGNGIRTRTTFIQAFRELGLNFTELPNLLKTSERASDLAGYLDPFYVLYVIRESNHARLAEFASASCRPVINAMSQEGHPCEVLTDAYYIHTQLQPLKNAKICLWGPPTNVFRSWHELADRLGISLTHVCAARFHETARTGIFTEHTPTFADIVITDTSSAHRNETTEALNRTHLASMGNPKLLPTPPFSIGNELAFDPLGYLGFCGYRQKTMLLAVQKALILYLVQNSKSYSPLA